MENSGFSVEVIEQDMAADHIPAGKGLATLRQSRLLHHDNVATVGFSLLSEMQGSKDIIKISGARLDANTANHLVLFVPEAVVDKIDRFKVVEKQHLSLSGKISGVLRRPNTNCASCSEPAIGRFHVRSHHGQTRPKYHYYGKTFSHDSAAEAQ